MIACVNTRSSPKSYKGKKREKAWKPQKVCYNKDGGKGIGRKQGGDSPTPKGFAHFLTFQNILCESDLLVLIAQGGKRGEAVRM